VKVTDAHAGVTAAEQKVRDAETELAAARDRLDAEVAAVGWKRLVGGFTQDATPLYTSRLYPDAVLEVNDVLEHLEHQRRAAA
jgi:hypothetical protein